MKRPITAAVFVLLMMAAGLGVWGITYRGRSSVSQVLAPMSGISSQLGRAGGSYSGTLEAEEVVISSQLAGYAQALYADVGDEVTAGQRLAQLDAAMLNEQIQGAEAELQAAQAGLAEIQAGARSEEIQIAEAAVLAAEEAVAGAQKSVALAEGNVAAAQTALQAAQAELHRVRAGASDNELALAEAQLELARQRLQLAWSARDSVGGAEQRGEVPPGSYDAARAVVAEVEAGVGLAELKLQDLKTKPRTEDVQAAQAAVEAAQARVRAAQARVVGATGQLEAARARLRQAQAKRDLARAGATPEQVALAKAQLKKAQAALKILQIQRDKMTLRAPRAGVILDRAIHVGEKVLPGATLFRVGNLEQVRLTVYVPGTVLGRVYVGQPARVTVGAFPGQVFQGQVVYIASQAEFTPRNLQTRDQRVSQVYGVRIAIPNPDGVLKPGMPAEAEIGE